MRFDPDKYEVVTKEVGGITVTYRAFRDIPYCERPAYSSLQMLGIFVPEEYFHGRKINGYDINSAPVFFSNSVGGYREGQMEEPGYKVFGNRVTGIANPMFCGLQRGYICVSAGIRGRNSRNEAGERCGDAPALIIDHKAVIRYLKANADLIPGDQEKIIVSGTSAGGALTSMAGATANHPDYEKYLKGIGAADASDAVFAISSYCPITNLDNADMAYEWEFDGVYDFNRMKMVPGAAGRPDFTREKGTMSEERIEISKAEAALFPAYINSLNLKDENGNSLTLDEKGNGSFKEYIKKVVLDCANRQIKEHVAEKYAAASDRKEDPIGQPEEKGWLTMENGSAVDMDFTGWASEITRMKTAPAFDDITCDSPENSEFGDRHFTEFSLAHSHMEKPEIADPEMIRLLNPMYYIEDPQAETCKNWRIRHGERDRDTSLAISAILVLKLKENGANVDYQSVWERPHSGSYDLDELFDWIDGLCR